MGGEDEIWDGERVGDKKSLVKRSGEARGEGRCVENEDWREKRFDAVGD
jgi:hypothetical protein